MINDSFKKATKIYDILKDFSEEDFELALQTARTHYCSRIEEELRNPYAVPTIPGAKRGDLQVLQKIEHLGYFQLHIFSLLHALKEMFETEEKIAKELCPNSVGKEAEPSMKNEEVPPAGEQK